MAGSTESKNKHMDLRKTGKINFVTFNYTKMLHKYNTYNKYNINLVNIVKIQGHYQAYKENNGAYTGMTIKPTEYENQT